MADLDAMTRDELLKLCKDRGGIALAVMNEYAATVRKICDRHVEFQSEHAATLAEFEDLKSQHETLTKRLEIAERLVEQQQTEIRRLRGFGQFLMQKETNNDD